MSVLPLVSPSSPDLTLTIAPLGSPIPITMSGCLLKVENTARQKDKIFLVAEQGVWMMVSVSQGIWQQKQLGLSPSQAGSPAWIGLGGDWVSCALSI